MPSNKDPNQVVNPGPGLLPAGVVPASALLFIPGSGASAALQAHINNPHDAHLAHAIGVDPYYPGRVGPTPDPILSSVGGVVAGESVLDFINQFKALIPPPPNTLGSSIAVGGTGVPNWGHLNASGIGTGTTVTGGYAQSAGTGQPVTFTHFLTPSTVTTFTTSGLLFPADRGVLAFYSTTGGNFFNAGQTTLLAALSLNDTAPSGIPHAAFHEGIRNGGPGGPAPLQQVNYTGSGSGLDQFSLTYRLPYLMSYAAYSGVPFGPFPNNFPYYQLAEFVLASQTVSVGNSQSFLLVHWKETYATSLTAIQPSHLTLSSMTTTNCYSAGPVSGNFDDNTQPIYNVNRHNIFVDSSSGSSPVGTVFTSSPNGTTTTAYMSGVQYYNSTTFGFTLDIQATGVFAQSFQTGSLDAPPNVPAQFHSASNPIQLDFTNFGGGIQPFPYYELEKHGGSAYSNSNSPQPGDTVELSSSLLIYTPSPFCPQGGYAQLPANLRTPFHETTYTDTNKYLFDSYTPGALPTTTYEPFVDEYYRYASSFNQTSSSTVPIVATGGNVFNSTLALSSGGQSLQVMGHALGYPQTDYNVGTFFPAQSVDYSGFPGGDGANHVRQYVRAVDTGTARNTGWIRLRGLAQAAFTTNAAYDGTETTGHTTGGAIIQIAVPGPSGTGWLDLGRQYGDPGIATLNFYGCQTGVIISGSDIYVSFNTTAFTSNNGSGNFLLFVRVLLLNGAGTSLVLQEFQYYPPTFVPP